MCPVAADRSTKSLVDTCGRARCTCASAARYYIYVNIYLLLDLHGITDKTYHVCAPCQRLPIYFFFLDEAFCKTAEKMGRQVSSLATW